jgi:cytochrome c oxidase cbb3-type subunit III
MSRRRRGDVTPRVRSLLWGVLTAASFAACGYDRAASSTQPPPAEAAVGHVPQTPLVPGMRRTGLTIANPYAGDTGAQAEGKRLYTWMNCGGCHFEGGGGIGPPLMDDDWIYGGEPAQIYDSIASGRANGMPTFGDKLAAQQIWQIVTYVETLNVDRGRAAPSGDDDGR